MAGVSNLGAQSDPSFSFAAVSPDDATILRPTRAIYVGVTGDLSVMGAEDGAAVVFAAVPAGSLMPLRVVKVLSTGTTAGGIVALF